VTLPPAAAYYVAQAFVGWLSERTGVPQEEVSVGIGRDPRLSGPALRDAAAAGAASRGASVSDFGIATTPACFMSCVMPGFQHHGAVMLTASHLPWNRNGAKFFTAEGGLDKADITDILGRAASAWEEAGGALPQLSGAEVTDCPELMRAYAGHLRGVIRAGVGDLAPGERPLEGLRVCVDAGNGSGGFFASDVLAPLGADVACSQFLDPDGEFPNHAPNPEDKAAMASPPAPTSASSSTRTSTGAPSSAPTAPSTTATGS